MSVAPSLQTLGLLLGLSFFLGLAFEDFFSHAETRRPGGVRIFPLLALAGGMLYLFDPVHLIPYTGGLLVLGGWLAVFYREHIRECDEQGEPNVGLVVRASSADMERPLSSVHAAPSDGAHEAQQRDEPIGVVTREALDERGRQPARIDRRHERGASDLPEWCRGKAVTPPCAPPLDGAAIDADHLGQLPHAQRRCTVPQDRDQHHDRGNVDLGAEEAQRRRRRPRPAAIDRAAEAEALYSLLDDCPIWPV